MLSQLNRWELGILDWIRDFFGAPFLDTAVPIFTMLGNAGWIWIVISILLMCLPKHRKAGIILAVVGHINHLHLAVPLHGVIGQQTRKEKLLIVTMGGKQHDVCFPLLQVLPFLHKIRCLSGSKGIELI